MSNTSDGQDAIATLTNYPLKIDSAGHRAATIGLGPWKLFVHCTYGACNGNWAEYWYSVDFSGPRYYLQSVCNSAEAHAKTFLQTFQPINLWLKATLPNFSRQFDSDTGLILKTLGEVQNNNPTPEQRQEISRLLNESATGLEQSRGQLESGVSQMGGFLAEQENWGNLISQAKDNLISSAQSSLKGMKDFTGGQPCGGGDADAQQARFQASFKTAVQQYESIFGDLKRDTVAANASIARLMGIVTNFINYCTTSAETIKSAQGPTFVTFLQRIKANAAEKQWETLAAYASGQFQNPALLDVLARAA